MDYSNSASPFTLNERPSQTLAKFLTETDQITFIGDANTGSLLFANQPFESVFGKPLSEFAEAPSSWIESLETESASRFQNALGRLSDQAVVEVPVIVDSGVSPKRSLSLRLIRADEGDAGQMLFAAIGKDLTELQTTRNKLRDSEVLYGSLVENLPLNVIRKDLAGRIVFANQRFSTLINKPLSELVGKTDFDLFPDELATKYTRDDRHVLETGETLHAEEEHRSATGETTYVEVFKGPVRDMRDRIIGVQVLFWDVTQRKKTEKKLRHERFLLHTLLDNLPDSIYFKNEKSQFVRVSRSLAEKFGCADPTEAIGKTDANYFADEHANLAYEDEQKMMASGKPVLGKVEKETWIDGHTSWCTTSKLPLRDDSGRVVGTFGISRDITELIEIEEALARERDLLRTLMDQLPDLIYVKDSEGKFITVNRAAQAMLGAPSIDATVGKRRQDFFPSSTSDRYEDDDRYVLETGKPLIDREEKVVDPSGKERWMLITKVPLRDDQENVIGLVGIDRDNTKRKQAVEAMRRAKETSDRANAAKSDFLANMSHEIRTPMNAIIGMTELLLETDVNETQRDYLHMIRESGESLLNIINDILDFSKIEADKLELDPIVFNPREDLEDTMRSLALRAHDKGIEAAIRVSPTIPDRLEGDSGRIRQIVINLVGNAIKFTERGEVVLEVDTAESDNGHVLLKLVVSDTGIGIPAEKQRSIFQAFEQADTSTTRSFGGTGLGLAISARLAKLMGGRIWVESEPGQGSKFFLTARLKRVEGTEQSPVLDASSVLDTRVLVVDDNATNRRILQDMLNNWGLQPTIAEGAEEGLELLRNANRSGTPFQIVLTDVNMPSHDGFELANWIRTDPELANTPVVMLTSAIRPNDISARKALDIQSHLLKPVKQSELFNAIVSSMGSHPETEETATDDQAQPEEPVRKLDILLAEDNVVNQRLAMGVLGKYGHNVRVVETGLQAVQAVQTDRFDLVLMDVQMPEMDGFEATREIRRLEESTHSHLPIIAMTAHAMKGDRERCIDAGMDDYIAKPIRMNLLLEKLQTHVPSSTDTNPEPRTSAKVIDWDDLHAAVANDDDLLAAVLESFLEEAPQLIETIETSFQSNASESLSLAAHSLKGALQAISASNARDQIKKLEALIREEQLTTNDINHAKREIAQVLDVIRQYLSRS